MNNFFFSPLASGISHMYLPAGGLTPSLWFRRIYIDRLYHDGLDGGRDMRSFAGFYFLLRYLLCLSVSLSHRLKQLSSSLSTISLIFISAAMLVSLIRPYKRMYMNVLDTLLLSYLAAIFHLLSTDYINSAKGVLTFVVTLVPAVVFWICFVFMVCKKLKKQCIQSNKNLAQEVTRYGNT